MFKPGHLPRRLRGIITDERGDSICFDKGSHRVVDDREFRWSPGRRVVHGRIVVLDGAKLRVDGELRVTAAGSDSRNAQQPRVTAQAAEVTAIRGSPFVRLLLGSRGHLHAAARFEARNNAQARLHDHASGIAHDESEIFFEETSRGQVLLLGNRVRLVAPPGRALAPLQDTKRGLIARLAW